MRPAVADFRSFVRASIDCFLDFVSHQRPALLDVDLGINSTSAPARPLEGVMLDTWLLLSFARACSPFCSAENVCCSDIYKNVLSVVVFCLPSAKSTPEKDYLIYITVMHTLLPFRQSDIMVLFVY